MSQHAILTVEDHRDLRVVPRRSAAFGDDTMCCMVVPAEFRNVQSEFPILFRLSLERDSFAAFALFGFEDGENLFLAEGGWSATYCPLVIDTKPFLVGRSADPARQSQVHIDMASPRLSKEVGERLFGDDGRPTPYLDQIAGKLGVLDAGYQASGAFFDALRRHDLLEPLALDITLADGDTKRLVGFHIIAEDRLRALDDDDIAQLHRDDHLMPIYMAMASLSNIRQLMERKNARIGGE